MQRREKRKKTKEKNSFKEKKERCAQKEFDRADIVKRHAYREYGKVQRDHSHGDRGDHESTDYRGAHRRDDRPHLEMLVRNLKKRWTTTTFDGTPDSRED